MSERLHTLNERLDRATAARTHFFDERHVNAFRLFNGFIEGCPELVIDLYGKTGLIHHYGAPTEIDAVTAAQRWLLAQLPWIETVVVKARKGANDQEKRGVVTFGRRPDRKVREHGVWYSADLLMNRDASFYLDTRNLRRWILDNLDGKTVLNTFAYTGSLGVAAVAAGATRVIQSDLNRQFLNVAKTSHTLNGFPIDKKTFVSADFFPYMNRLKRAGERFDCVIVDPPFFSRTRRGTVDLAKNVTRLVNKVRPIVNHGGQIVVINNALFFSGRDFWAALQSLCGPYVEIAGRVDVSADFTGYPSTRLTPPITDPAPFNHSTKIAILNVFHKVEKSQANS